MAAPPSRAVRLEAMLVLGRLAARNRACQQDAVREGVVPVLVEMMMAGELITGPALRQLGKNSLQPVQVLVLAAGWQVS